MSERDPFADQQNPAELPQQNPGSDLSGHASGMPHSGPEYNVATGGHEVSSGFPNIPNVQGGETGDPMARLAAMQAEAATPTPMGKTPTASGGPGSTIRQQAGWAGPRGIRARESEGARFKRGQ